MHTSVYPTQYTRANSHNSLGACSHNSLWGMIDTGFAVFKVHLAWCSSQRQCDWGLLNQHEYSLFSRSSDGAEMPIYEYRCKECSSVFEELIKMSDPTPPCPSCGDEEVTKLMSQTTFHLKGTGWYVTDYGKSGSPGGDASESSSASANDGPKESKKESKKDSGVSSGSTSDA